MSPAYQPIPLCLLGCARGDPGQADVLQASPSVCKQPAAQLHTERVG
jgi:hypothetical protein